MSSRPHSDRQPDKGWRRKPRFELYERSVSSGIGLDEVICPVLIFRIQVNPLFAKNLSSVFNCALFEVWAPRRRPIPSAWLRFLGFDGVRLPGPRGGTFYFAEGFTKLSRASKFLRPWSATKSVTEALVQGEFAHEYPRAHGAQRRRDWIPGLFHLAESVGRIRRAATRRYLRLRRARTNSLVQLARSGAMGPRAACR